MMAAMTITRLPNRVTSHPVNGRLVINPTGSAKSTDPSCASLSLKNSFTSGIRLAHDAKTKPAMKKNAVTEILACNRAGEGSATLKVSIKTQN